MGTVKWFDAGKGFGFVAPDEGGKDVFVHISVVESSGIAALGEGQRLSFEVEKDARGRLSATAVRPA
jgi:cold shock protein